MLRVAVLRALAFAAVFAAVWLVPQRAYAAIVPLCEADLITLGATSAASAEEIAPADCSPTASPSEHADDEADPQVAAMCDERGATVIAPGRIHPMTDARIDAVNSCDGTYVGPSLGPSQGQETPAAAPFATVPDAVLTAYLELRPAQSGEILPPSPVEGAPRRGVRRAIDHPPRV